MLNLVLKALLILKMGIISHKLMPQMEIYNLGGIVQTIAGHSTDNRVTCQKGGIGLVSEIKYKYNII